MGQGEGESGGLGGWSRAAAWVRVDVLDAREREAVDADGAARVVEVGDLAGQLHVGRQAARARERDGAVALLDAVLQEERHLDVLVLEEAAQRLAGAGALVRVGASGCAWCA